MPLFAKSGAKSFLRYFVIVAVKLVLSLLNSAQITALDSGSTRANCFVFTNEHKTVICYH